MKKTIQPKHIGYWMIIWGFVGMLTAQYRGAEDIIFIQGVFMVVGAVLSLHPMREKKRVATNVTFNGQVSPEHIAESLKAAQGKNADRLRYYS